MKHEENQPATRTLEIGGTAQELGEFQFEVLTLVCEHEFEQAILELKAFQQLKSTYPKYEEKTSRLFGYAEELIKAIDTKMNFPNLSALPQSKQEEIYSKISENWEDLKLSLRRIRTIEKDLHVQDARSSIYVVRAVLFSFVFLLFVFLLKEFTHNFGGTIVGLWHDSSETFLDFIDHL